MEAAEEQEELELEGIVTMPRRLASYESNFRTRTRTRTCTRLVPTPTPTLLLLLLYSYSTSTSTSSPTSHHCPLLDIAAITSASYT